MDAFRKEALSNKKMDTFSWELQKYSFCKSSKYASSFKSDLWRLTTKI